MEAKTFRRLPIITTILNVDLSARVRVVSQLILGITPGPSRLADLESFFTPITDELNALAAGVTGVTVAGHGKPEIVCAFGIQFTTGKPRGDKMLNAMGGNGDNPGRFRRLSGVRRKRRYNYQPYAPDYPPPSKRRCFDIMGNSTARGIPQQASLQASPGW